MTFFSILESLLIGPLKLSFEIIFEIAYQIIGHPGVAIIFLSLTMNILVLPLYRRTDTMQKDVRDKEAKLHAGVAHIKKTFSGDEQMMILQTYYRQNHYKPTDALSGCVSLLLEIPFFMAAYQFLSHLEVLQGVCLGPIRDLGAPDGLLVVGSVSINLLPVLMTMVNVISSALYLKGFPLKTKLQLYGIALFFLVFLYASPACLVFYWTLNNVFSLVKNIFYKLKNPKRVLFSLCFGVGLALLVFGGIFYETNSFRKKLLLNGIGLLLLFPLYLPVLKRAVSFLEIKSEPRPNQRLFLLGTVFLTILTGLLIPSAFIAASPQEYIDITYFYNPSWYIVHSFCIAAGTFLVWMRVFYWLARPTGKYFLDQLVWILCGVALVNYMFFGTDLGTLSSTLQYVNGMSFSWRERLTNLLIIILVAIILYLCARKWKQGIVNVLVISSIALGAMSAWNLVTIKTSVDKLFAQGDLAENRAPYFQLSTKGRNVIVIMLDRAMGEYVPYLFHEKPELKRQFDGFTYYKNTISFGGHTNFGAPALFGGYEYTPVEMNKRKEESLVSKHNEALKLMPVIFSENGYKVTVCDPPYANYQWIPDLSIYDDCHDVAVYNTDGQFEDVAQKLAKIDGRNRNFFCFSVMKSMPLILQPGIYDYGQYYQCTSGSTKFINPYCVLVNLPDMTKVTTDTINTFLTLSNATTHEPMLLQAPDYVPAQDVDNTAYDAEHTDRFLIDDRELKMKDEKQVSHYHVNMAAMIQLGKWFDHLRENNVYDNTRIILVSDHGYCLAQLDELILGDSKGKDVEYYYPLLMVKDFNSEGFVTSDTFMTNADVPVQAMKDLIPNPKNPFTGNSIRSDEKTSHDQFILISEDWSVDSNNGNTFQPAAWAGIKDNIWDKDNWTFYDELTILKEHAMP